MKGGKTKTGFLAGILVLLLVAVPAMGEQKEANLMNVSQTFNIEAGVLEDALDNYSEVTGIKTVYLNELVEGKKSPGVQGIYSSEAAVQKILKGTGLTYQVTAENTVVLKENKMVVAQKGSKATSKREEAEKKEKARRPIEIEEMVVTAQKREENVQDVPASITALSEVQIEDARIESTSEIHTFIPNFTSFKLGNGGLFSYYSIRGQSNFIQTTRSVGIYIDDAPTSCAANATDSTIYDIERIEVLSGPQGNLYGMNSSGGVVNIITKKPGNIWTAKATGGIGDYETHFYNASVSGPVVKDKLFIGLSGSREKQDEGYLDNGATHPDTIDMVSGRVQLRWTPIEELDIIFSASGESRDSGMGFFIPVDDDPFKIPNVNLDERNDGDVNTQSLRIKYEAPWFVVTSVSARNSNEYDSVYTPDLTGMNLMNMKYLEDVTDYSQEIRLNSVDSDNPFQWIVGGFYFDAEDTSDMTVNMDACLFDPTGMTPPGLMTIEDTTYSVLDTTTYSAFGQAGYTFFDRLTLTGGLRYDRDKKEMNYKHTGVAPYDASETWEAWSPKFIVDYRWNPSMLTYASVAKGYKAGGFTGGYTAKAAEFDPQYVWSYEAGVKTDWLDRRLILNAAMFYTKAKDLQVMRYDPITGFPDFRNAAKATIQGLEIELLARPLQGLDIMASFGLLDTKFDENKDPFNPAGPKDYTGNKVPLSPGYTASLAAHYRSPWGISVRGEAAWTGDTYYDEANTHEQEAYCIANGKIGYEKEHFDIYFFVNNIFEKEYWTFLYSSMMGPTDEMGCIGDPRTLGVMATVRF